MTACVAELCPTLLCNNESGSELYHVTIDDLYVVIYRLLGVEVRRRSHSFSASINRPFVVLIAVRLSPPLSCRAAPKKCASAHVALSTDFFAV